MATKYSEHFNAIIHKMAFPKDVTTAVKETLNSNFKSLAASILTGELEVSDQRLNLETVLSSAKMLLEKEIEKRMPPIEAPTDITPSELPISTKLDSKNKPDIHEIISNRNKFIEEFKSKTQDAENFVKEMNKNAKAIKEKMKSAKEKSQKAKELKAIEEAKLAEEETIKIKQQKEEEKKEKHHKFAEKLKHQQQERQVHLSEPLTKKNYVYLKIQSDFEKQLKDEEERKKKVIEELKIKKSGAKPIYKNEVKEREKKIKEDYQNVEKSKQQQVENVRQSQEKAVEFLENIQEKYKVAAKNKTEVDIKEEKAKQALSKKLKVRKLNTMKKVAKLLQEEHKPKPSISKQKELQDLINKIKTKPKVVTHSAEGSPRDKKDIDPDKRYPWRKNLSKHPKNLSIIDNVLPDILSARPMYKNYLDEQRKGKKGSEDLIEKIKIDEIIKQKHVDKIDKYERVKQQVSMIEEKAKRKEKLMNLNKTTDQDNFEEATNLFLGAINAKLSLLDHLDEL